VVASAAGVVGMVTMRVRGAISKVEKYRSKLDEAIAHQVEKPAQNVKTAQAQLDKLTADVAEARAVMATTSDRLAEATREYTTGTGRGRLLRFVRERAANGEYAKHLGLVANVRRDFTDLSAMMSATDTTVKADAKRQGEAYKLRVKALIDAADRENLLTLDDKRTLENSTAVPVTTEDVPFERIILYIDDLDRCPPGKVVDVLQAVHLLLTFPLFVVIVAVDARWVSRSLEKHYEKLLSSGDVTGPPGATSRDYLEKIFQVPYWVRPMTEDGSRDLLSSLAEPPDDSPKDKQSENSGAGEAPPPNGLSAEPAGSSDQTAPLDDTGDLIEPEEPKAEGNADSAGLSNDDDETRAASADSDSNADHRGLTEERTVVCPRLAADGGRASVYEKACAVRWKDTAMRVAVSQRLSCGQSKSSPGRLTDPGARWPLSWFDDANRHRDRIADRAKILVRATQDGQ
jgi:hypothetical protein